MNKIRIVISCFTIMLLVFVIYSCDETITDLPQNPEISEGNIWLPATVLPDTGDTSHYVSTQDLTIDNGNNIYVATDFAGIFKSTDQGNTWSSKNNGLKHIEEITQSKQYTAFSLGSFNGHLFAGTPGGIYYSSNGGSNWTLNYQGIEDDQFITCFRSENGRDIYAGGYHKLIKTSNNGRNWQDIGLNLNWNDLHYVYDIDFSSNGTIYAATNGGLLKSSDDGRNWINIGPSCRSIEIDTDNNMYLVGWNTVYLSIDNAATWTRIFELQDDFNRTEDIYVNKSGAVFLCSYDGIYRSKDKGQTWLLVGLEQKDPVRIIYNKEGKLVAATFRQGVYISPE